MKSLFVYDPRDLEAPIMGGVQLCTRDFLDVVRVASDEVRLATVSVTRSPVWRLRRKFGLGSYLFYHPGEFRAKLRVEMGTFKPTHVFLNRCELLRLSPVFAELWPGVRVIAMSHGNQSGDDLYEVAGPGGQRASGVSRKIATWHLGHDLVTESIFRHCHLNGVCVMSDEEETLERWLGAKSIFVIPRIVQYSPLEWAPVDGRVGFVGTLNHTPNRIALERLCESLASMDISGFELRFVGGPESAGKEIENRWAFATYVGRLSDDDLRSEAATWSVFLNPIFWLSRGASMKLGQALAWALPTVSTRSGARGYRLSEGEVLLTEDDPGRFASELVGLVRDKKRFRDYRANLLALGSHRVDSNVLGQELRAWADDL